MKKFTSMIKSVLVLAAMFIGIVNANAWNVTLSENQEVAGYKLKAFYDFKNDADAIALVPTSGDFRYRDANNGWYNFGAGNRGGDIAIAVAEGDIIVFDCNDTQGRGATVNSVTNGVKNDILSTSLNHPTFDITADAATINVNIGRAGCIMSILVMEKDNSVATAGYTVNYVCNGEVVKSETLEGVVGEVPVYSKDPIFTESNKYLYVSDDAEGVVIASDGSTVVTVTMREAEVWGYMLTTNFGDFIAYGEDYEHSTVNAAYPRYINVNGNLIKANPINSQYRLTFVLDHDGYEAVCNYEETDINDVVYCSEAEDINGLELNTYGNVAVRASNALTAFATENTVVTNLEAGQYKVVAGVFTSKSTPDYVIKIGICDSIWNAPVTAVNASEVSIENVNVAGGEVILYAEGMDKNNALDYIYIQKTGEYVAPEGGDPTAIKNVNVETSNVMYNLAGQRVSKANGIAIMNGKKIVK